MGTHGTGAEIIPAILILAAAIPVLWHRISGEHSPFTRDPMDAYAAWFRRIIRR